MSKPTSTSTGNAAGGAAEPSTPAGQTLTVTELENLCQTNIEEYDKAPKTKKAYAGYLARARVFLREVVEERIRLNVRDGIANSILEHAFDSTPNKHSAYALQLFIGKKCFSGKQCSKSTADGIYSAWIQEWTKACVYHQFESSMRYICIESTISSDRGFGGEYVCDKVTGEVKGCPARSHEVRQVVKAVKTRAGKKGVSANRHHAEAITIEEMGLIMRWSESICSHVQLQKPPLHDVNVLKIVDKHGLFRAFASTAFTLFTRCVSYYLI